MRAMCAALLLIFGGPALAQEAHPLVGTWKLISQQAIVEGEAPEEVFGANPKGYLIATREGRLMVLLTAEHRKGGMGDAERAALHKSMAAATGNTASRAAISSSASTLPGMSPGTAPSSVAISGSKATG